jgi:dTDP-glucose 4,6-dehydratase
MNWQGRKSLVTGAGGFIGSHLCERLVRAGASVKAFVRYNSRNDPGLLRYVHQEVRSEIELVAGDLRDVEAVRRAVSGTERVLHLGALIGIPYSYQHPREVVEVNVLGTLNVMQAARETGVERVIHTSTSEVYGTAQTDRISESHPLCGQSPYSASKIGADKVAESYHLAFSLPVTTVRPFNTYGPRQSARAVIPTIVSQALTGSRIRLGNLAAVRDFTFVTDTVDGMMLVALAEGVEGLSINLGNDAEISVQEVVHLVARMLSKELQTVEDVQRLRPEHSEVHRLRANNELAQRCGWKPRVSLEDGLVEVVDWVRAHPELYDENRYEI